MLPFLVRDKKSWSMLFLSAFSLIVVLISADGVQARNLSQHRFNLPPGTYLADDWEKALAKAKRKRKFIGLLPANRLVNGYGNNYCSVNSGKNSYKRKVFQLISDYSPFAVMVVMDTSSQLKCEKAQQSPIQAFWDYELNVIFFAS